MDEAGALLGEVGEGPIPPASQQGARPISETRLMHSSHEI